MIPLSLICPSILPFKTRAFSFHKVPTGTVRFIAADSTRPGRA